MPLPRLHLSRSFTASWEQIIRPQLQWIAGKGWGSTGESILLVPTRAHVIAVRQQLHKDALHIAALRIWTPNQAREFLAKRRPISQPVAVRENLHLLLSLAASQSAESPTAKAIMRDGSRLMRSLDSLAAGGHSYARTDAPLPDDARPVAAAFALRMKKLDCITVQQLDWSLLRDGTNRKAGNAKPIKSLVISGFDGLHWCSWPLLRALAEEADEADIILTQPRFKAEQIDQLWIGTWERDLGEASSLTDADHPQPYSTLAAKLESPDGDLFAPLQPAEILVGRNLTEQAEAIAARVSLWLAAGESVERIGILVPGPTPLAREISIRLLDRGIVHFDSIGHPAPIDSEAQDWSSWMALQRDQHLGPLLSFLPSIAPAVKGDASKLVEALAAAYGELLTDDLPVLIASLVASPREDRRDVAKCISNIGLLPSHAKLSEFIAAADSALEQFGWSALASELRMQTESITGLLGEQLNRSQFLDWLTSVTTDLPTQRDARTTNPAAPVHLLTYTDAESLSWSHLLMAGMNEGHWPPTFDPPGFLHEDDIAELNCSVTEAGPQGEGHFVIKEGHALILGPAEQRALARRQFYNLVEAPTHALALSAALEDDETSRALGPGDFLSHLYFTQTNEPLTAQRLTQLHAATKNWLATTAVPHTSANTNVEQTQIAYTARRANEPFGEYEFAMRESPATPITLPCKSWETAIQSPTSAWLANMLGVSADGDILDGNPWPLATGTWVHAWLSTAIAARHPEKLIPLRDPAKLPERVSLATHRTRDAAARAYAAAGRPLPDRWQAGWARAAWIAGEIATRVGTITDWPFAATEWSLPRPTEIKLRDATLRVRGRMDFVLSPDEVFSAGSNLWLFDFKTGTDKPLKPSDLLKKFSEGKSKGGIQLALYALALRALGAARVDITLLTPDALLAPQINSTDIETLSDFWHGLARMQDTGIFGMRGPLRSDYTHVQTMPLATLEIPPDLLEEKWALTHPLLVTNDK